MTQTITWLITGATRGIGHGFITTLAQRPSTTIIACVRDPSTASSQSLSTIPTAAGTRIITIGLDSASSTAAASAIHDLQTNHGITKLDVIIANAAVGTSTQPLTQTSIDQMHEHFTVNTLAPLLLFQAALPLLEKAEAPKWVQLSSSLGCLTTTEPVPSGAYGISKAAVNFLTKKIHVEHEGLVAFAVHPGFVQTDMAYASADGWGLPRDFVKATVEESVKDMLSLIDNATRENTSGKFIIADGKELPW
ncbi:hypothetical protein AJ80_01444 [Polytolypa hystricis UAMH7299]|uniref:Aflatoxin biosynthesis ketoreductase nor-1 n=1 Tax=Polytolypa hystricis (strain UAMH7299) TaxID=1447883 RepID=A0A2B7Z1B1_POLH7|nr:hypothetical protein AJ80_01444 [Polytolypa hystricis UAMH7299]